MHVQPTDMPAPGRSSTHLRKGTPEYRRTSLVLFLAGFMTFAMLYVVQGIMPDVSRDFSVSPAADVGHDPLDDIQHGERHEPGQEQHQARPAVLRRPLAQVRG